MIFRMVADLTAVLHFTFLAFVVVGGFLAWRWPRLILLHALAVVWGFSTVLTGLGCPLTYLENWARRNAGDAELPSTGFIDYYLTGVIYPENAVALVRALVLCAVLTSWLGFALQRRRHVAAMSRPATWQNPH
ncbi:hypothetical protein CBI38_36215 (plasmid) [Rhodococcus oxybenzonivorans]|uniref:DUF2784 domain-containing protein n=1 Tax=Rhodococcus oxybenzonivorans TaxID=1990687 RepID=A0A2S2C7X8_9NOCA|nr:DUF2784 domain-containing protein [Rhodococcus oxybenzonivorans]AWK76962.1 hypothetical protein CBI38_36215 [Rhodococcus oxybenzonivorans]